MGRVSILCLPTTPKLIFKPELPGASKWRPEACTCDICNMEDSRIIVDQNTRCKIPTIPEKFCAMFDLSTVF